MSKMELDGVTYDLDDIRHNYTLITTLDCRVTGLEGAMTSESCIRSTQDSTLAYLLDKVTDLEDRLSAKSKQADLNVEVVVTDDRLLEYGLPAAQTRGSAGLDLRVFLPEGSINLALAPGEQVLLDTGMQLWIKDPGYAGFMFARSGTGNKGLVLGNGTGVIDSDYQGPLKVCLWNRSSETIVIESGDRVAQLVILPVASGYTLQQVDAFSDRTERGYGGWGSTGAK